MRTISSGFSLPRISAITFADMTSGSVRGVRIMCMRTRLFLESNRCTSIASSAVMAAAGIFGCFGS